MSKPYHETIRRECKVVHWTGNSAELAELVNAPVTVQPDGTATWPVEGKEGKDADFGMLPIEHVGVVWDDTGEFEAIPVVAFTQRFAKINGPRPRKAAAEATPPPPSGSGAGSEPPAPDA